MKLKNITILILFVISLTSLIYFSIDTVTSISSTIELYLTKVFPSLFLFILFTEILLSSNYMYVLSDTLSFIPKLFNLPKNATLPIILGYLCGFPSASKAIDKLYSQNMLSKKDAYHLMAFCNNASPIFIISTIGSTMLENKTIGIYLYLIHILSSIIIGLVYSKLPKSKYIILENSLNLKYNSKINNQNTSFKLNLSQSIISSLRTMAIIFVYMLLFNTLADILNSHISNPILKTITCCFEITKGIYMSYNSSLNLIAFLLGFSSFSIIFQIKSSLKNLNYSTYTLIFFKLLHGFISLIISFFIFR